MTTLKIAKPLGFLSTLVFPCANEYSKRFEDLFYSRISRAVKLSNDNNPANELEVDKALQVAVNMKDKESVRLYLTMLSDMDLISTKTTNHLLKKLNGSNKQLVTVN